jgi:hypothetical protein
VGGVVEASERQRWGRLDDDARLVWARTLAGMGGVVVDRANEAISVSGPCPSCGHDFQVTITEREILAGLAHETRSVLEGSQGKVDWQGVVRFEAFCYCTDDHEGRPSDVTHGCGAAGFLRDSPGG